jgi:Bacterial transcriptional activator domain
MTAWPAFRRSRHDGRGDRGMNHMTVPSTTLPFTSLSVAEGVAVDTVVAADPLREAMWRTLMRIRSAVGDYDGVVSTFAQCQRALRAAEIAPPAATRALLDQLRR